MLKLFPVAAVALLTLAGCKPKPEDQIPGTWSASGVNNISFAFNKDKTWTGDVSSGGRSSKITGNWDVSGKTVSVTFKTIAGQPVAQVTKMMNAMAKRMKTLQVDAEAITETFKGQEFTLSDDGKTLTQKNPKRGTPMTLKKEG